MKRTATMHRKHNHEYGTMTVPIALEVAELLNMTRSQVARLTNCGRLKSLKYSRKNGTALYYLPDVLEYAQIRKKEALRRKHIAEQRLIGDIGRIIGS